MNKRKRNMWSPYMLRRYLAMLFAIITFLSAIPLTNLTIAKAWAENNYTCSITVNLNGGTSGGKMYYVSEVDNNGNGRSKGDWIDGLAVDYVVTDIYGKDHTIVGQSGCQDPVYGTSFNLKADAVGITPHVVIPNPTRPGYKFVGWSTITKYGDDLVAKKDYQGKTAFYAGCYSPLQGEDWAFTITANWEPNNYTISFNSNGGSTPPRSSVQVTYKSTTNNNVSSNTPTRTGYKFDGWYTSTSGGYQVYNSSGVCTTSGGYWNSSKQWVGTNDITLYAHWTSTVSPSLLIYGKEDVSATYKYLFSMSEDKGRADAINKALSQVYLKKMI